jgi:hypothetical protein
MRYLTLSLARHRRKSQARWNAEKLADHAARIEAAERARSDQLLVQRKARVLIETRKQAETSRRRFAAERARARPNASPTTALSGAISAELTISLPASTPADKLNPCPDRDATRGPVDAEADLEAELLAFKIHGARGHRKEASRAWTGMVKRLRLKAERALDPAGALAAVVPADKDAHAVADGPNGRPPRPPARQPSRRLPRSAAGPRLHFAEPPSALSLTATLLCDLARDQWIQGVVARTFGAEAFDEAVRRVRCAGLRLFDAVLRGLMAGAREHGLRGASKRDGPRDGSPSRRTSARRAPEASARGVCPGAEAGAFRRRLRWAILLLVRDAARLCRGVRTPDVLALASRIGTRALLAAPETPSNVMAAVHLLRMLPARALTADALRSLVTYLRFGLGTKPERLFDMRAHRPPFCRDVESAVALRGGLTLMETIVESLCGAGDEVEGDEVEDAAVKGYLFPNRSKRPGHNRGETFEGSKAQARGASFIAPRSGRGGDPAARPPVGSSAREILARERATLVRSLRAVMACEVEEGREQARAASGRRAADAAAFGGGRGAAVDRGGRGSPDSPRPARGRRAHGYRDALRECRRALVRVLSATRLPFRREVGELTVQLFDLGLAGLHRDCADKALLLGGRAFEE